jgi:putative ABC transport system permease protein
MLLIFGLWPALRAARLNVRSAMFGSLGSGGTMSWRSQRGVIVGQVAVAALFLFVAAVCLRALFSDTGGESGVDVDRLVLAEVNFRANHWDETRGREAAMRILTQAQRSSGFEAMALASGMPFGLPSEQMSLTVPGLTDPNGSNGQNAYVIAGTPELFHVLGVPVLSGRGFTDGDRADAPLVAVISTLTAHNLFGDTDAIGRQLSLEPYAGQSGIGGGSFTIVGIARDTDAPSQGRRRALVVYLPFAQRYPGSVYVVGRAPARGTAASAQLQAIVRKTEPELAIGVSGTGTVLMNGSALGLRVLGEIAILMGAVVLILTMAGLFGVLLHVVSSRTREFGVRQALGAGRRDIVMMVQREGLLTVRYGLVLGLAFGLLGRLALSSMIPSRLAGLDWLAVAVVPVPLVAAALLACYLPARRAASVDPSVALRDA